jgi:hypothetical protein
MAIYTVTTLVDENDGGAGGTGLSLREALALANATPADADTITFAAGLAGGTLFLTTGQQLAITTDGITIDGDIVGDSGADITISADSADGANDALSRVLLIDGAGTIAATLNGLAIRDGSELGFGPGPAGLGGGIYVGSADALILTNSSVAGNSTSFHGAGVYGSGGAAITLVNSTVFGNSAGGNGGGVQGYTGSAITLVNSTIAGNYAGGNGGGVFGFESTVTLSNTTVFGNYADDSGGGIGGAGDFVLSNSTVSGNGARYDGGGIWGLGAEITLSSSTVSGNYAGDDGGGIFNGQYYAVSGTTTLTNSIVAGNAAGGDGNDLGGGGTPLVFTGGNILGSAPVNFAPVTGAPTLIIDGSDQTALETVFARVAPDFFTGVLSGVLADNGGPVPTIALNRDAANPALDSGDAAQLVEATAGRDLNGDGDTGDTITTDARGFARPAGPGVDLGAFEQQAGQSFVVTTLDDEIDSIAPNATITDMGGLTDLSLREALFLAQQDPTSVDDITFDAGLIGGVTPADNGEIVLVHGELYVFGDVNIDGDVGGNGTGDITVRAAAANPSAVLHFYHGISSLNGVTITGGDALYGAGVSVGSYLSFGYADLTISNSVIDNNTALYGGGISVDTGSALRLVNSTVSGNEAEVGGGIAVNDGGALTVVNSTVANNRAFGISGGYGGGIAVNGGAIATLINSTIAGNNSSYGGGLYNAGDLTLINTTVANNSADELGGGLYNTICGCSSTQLFNSTLTGNYAYIGGGIYHAAGSLSLTNTIVAGNSAGQGYADAFLAGSTNYLGVNVVSQAGIGTPATVLYEPNLANIFAAIDPIYGGGLLANNGGPVETVAIRAGGGVAYNRGNAALLPADSEDLDNDTNQGEALPVDARGLPRMSGTGLDVGAFEVQNNAPVITSNGGGANAVVVVPENNTAVTTVTATDLQNDVLAFSIIGGADAARFQINAATGVLSFVTAPDFEAPTDAGHNNGYVVQVRASDGALFDEQTITVNVTDAAGFLLADSGDINGDGRDDLLWREEDGDLLVWYQNGTQNQAVSLGHLDAVWTIVGLGDFNGDGRDEIVRRHANGELVVDGFSRGVLDNVWSIDAIGDFNGDGRDELVYRRVNGELLVDGVSRGILDNVWSIDAVGDFNGDGRDELVYRHVNGELLVDGVSRGILDNVWGIEGAGDFNGDGREELVYRRANGEVLIDGVSVGGINNNRTIETIGDFDGNGRDELLWRHINGTVELDGISIGSLQVL